MLVRLQYVREVRNGREKYGSKIIKVVMVMGGEEGWRVLKNKTKRKQ